MPRFLSLIAVVALAAPAAGGQMVEAPIYTNWSKFPIGTTVSHRTVTESSGGTSESTTTQRLVSLDEKQAVVEEEYRRTTPGGEAEETSQMIRHRRWFPLPAGMKEEDIGKPSGTLAKGEETIELAGRAFEATWYDAKDRTEAGPSLSRTWISEEVPGQVLKSVTRVEAAGKVSTTELVAIIRP